MFRNYKLIIAICVCFISCSNIYAQTSRFRGNFPLAAPAKNSLVELKADYDNTLAAISGGMRLIEKENTPSKKTDNEVVTKQDFKNEVEKLYAYALETATTISTLQANPWQETVKDLEKLGKSIKGGKYGDAFAWLQAKDVKSSENQEELFLIWTAYLEDVRLNMPWTVPVNLDVTRTYRSVLEYVAKHFDRPYGLQAEQGAISSTTAQALSNCIEFRNELSWKGTGDITIKQDDQLRHLMANIVYYEWRLYTPINGQRAAGINKTYVRNAQKAAYYLIYSMKKHTPEWYSNPVLGECILQLYKDVLTQNWRVDGLRAIKKGAENISIDFYKDYTGRIVF